MLFIILFQSLILCLETQFDSVIVDRPMVLQSLYQLHNSLSDRRILTWEFFLNRFDTLFLEAQINLEKSGDVTYLRGWYYPRRKYKRYDVLYHVTSKRIVLLE